MDKPNVLFFSEVNWGYLRQRHHFFAESYNRKDHRVIYIGKVGLRYPKIKEVFNLLKWTKDQEKPKVNSDIQFYNGFFLPPINFLFNAINEYFFLKRIIKSISGSKVIIHFYQPTELILGLIKKLHELNYDFIPIYDCVQDYRFHPSRVKGLLHYENSLIQKSKLILADSKVNFDRLHCTNKILVPPGVDTHHFRIKDYLTTSTDIKKILYYGNIRQDLDIRLINRIGLSKNLEITLIGLLNIDRGKIHSSVEVLNSVDYTELPGIIKNYDALILPYDIENPFTEAIIPAKFFECVSTGLPVLSTKMKSTSDYHKYLTIISEKTDFNNLEINYLSPKLAKELNEVIHQSSWENRFQKFYDQIQ